MATWKINLPESYTREKMATRSTSRTAFHQRSKHNFGRYAPSPGSLDLETQPDPFRRFEGAPNTPLSLAANRRKVGYADLFEPGTLTSAPQDLDGLSALMELSFGLSAWKQYGGDR